MSKDDKFQGNADTNFPMTNINSAARYASNSIKRQYCLLRGIKPRDVKCFKHQLHQLFPDCLLTQSQCYTLNYISIPIHTKDTNLMSQLKTISQMQHPALMTYYFLHISTLLFYIIDQANYYFLKALFKLIIRYA